jgi:ABC-type nitrate/sulfonate/bicarbonate transport system substrate-binding protein
MDRLRINTFGRMGPHDVALKEGLYAAEQLDVDLEVTQSSKAQMRGLLDGSWQIVHSNADNVFWWDEDNGADFVIVMAAPRRPGQSFVVRPEITDYADLRGKPLAVDAAESGYVTPLRVLLKQGGLAEEGRDFTLLEVGSTQHRIDAMRDGRAYGAMISAGQETQLVDEGFRVLDSIDRLYTNYAGSAAVRRSWLESSQDALLRFLRAHLRALRSSGREAPPFSWEGLTEMLETRQEVGLLRGPVDPHRFADDSFYRDAVASL